MDTSFKDLVQDVINEEDLMAVKGGLMNPPKYGCQSRVCQTNSDYSSYCNSAVCQVGA